MVPNEVSRIVKEHAEYAHPAEKEFYRGLPTVYLDVDPYTIMAARSEDRARNTLHKAGVEAIDPYNTPQRIKRRAFRKLSANKKGEFTFYPGQLYLLRTKEFLVVPVNRRYELKPFFQVAGHDGSLSDLPLTTNISASILQGGDIARIAYEVINTSEENVRVNIKDMLAQAYVVPLSTPSDVTGRNRHGRFSTQLRNIRI